MQNAQQSFAATSIGILYQGAMREALIDQGRMVYGRGTRQTA
jgi:hypothetical protein